MKMALRLLATLCLAIVATTANADVNVAKGRAAAAVFDFSCLQNWQNTDQALSEFVRIVGRAGTQYADREGISVEASGIALSVSPVGYPMREHMAMPNDPLVAAAIVFSVSLTDLNGRDSTDVSRFYLE